jgi:hypothetical protein
MVLCGSITTIFFEKDVETLASSSNKNIRPLFQFYSTKVCNASAYIHQPRSHQVTPTNPMTRNDHVIRDLYPKRHKQAQPTNYRGIIEPLCEEQGAYTNPQRTPHAHALEAVNTVEQDIICLHKACVSQYEQITYTFSNDVGRMF